MAETSDGDNTSRHFKNILDNEKTSLSIKNSMPFAKLCNAIAMNNGKLHDSVTDDFKKKINSEPFKKYLMIPKTTIVEVNFVQPNLKILFSQKSKNNEHMIEIPLNVNTINTASDYYVKKITETNDQNQQVITNNSSIEEKFSALFEKIEKLTEENQKLKQTILELKQNANNNTSDGERRRKRIRGKTTQTTANTTTSNIVNTTPVESIEIDASSEDSLNSVEHNSMKATTKSQQQNQSGADEACAKATQSIQPNGKQIRNKHIPPIVVFDDNQKRMNEKILNNKICERNEYHFVRVNKSKYRIIVSNINQYDKIIELLNEMAIKYHTYTPPERKPIHVLIKNVPVCYDESEILDFLNNDHGLFPIKITKFITKYMQENNIQSTIWHASFDPKTDKTCIFSVKHIGNQYGIAVEPIKNKSVTQCRRCWRFEHTQTNCTYDIRCPNCLATHATGNCALDKNRALKPACVNCKSEAHAATSKECPVYARIFERRNNAGNKNKKQTKPASNEQSNQAAQLNLKKGGTYANVVGQKSSQKQNHQASNVGDLRDIMKELAAQQVKLNQMFMNIAPQLFGFNANG